MQGFGFMISNINAFHFIEIMFVFIILMVLLSAVILGITVYKKRNETNKKLWQINIDTMINQAIFFSEEDDEKIEIPHTMKGMLQKPSFRQHLINQIINAKKCISGLSAVNLNKLYDMVELDKDSFKKLNNAKWHIKARGIQELAMMEQIKYGEEIFKLTTNSNELVRNEAQCGMVSIYGLPGLHFLNETKYPVSQWQQVQLLNKLTVIPENFDVIKQSLQSVNNSVVIFSLKLATFYNCNDVYDYVINCLYNQNPQVKLTALEYLKKVSRADTPDQIIKYYSSENKIYKIAALKVLRDIGNENQISFLIKQLHDKDDDIKTAAAKSLSHIHPSGAAFLQTRSFADKNPWKEIFLQLKKEHAA